jgi:N-acetylneuraminic acid mutarotase
MYFSTVTLPLLLLNTLGVHASPTHPYHHVPSNGSWETLASVPLYPRQEQTTVFLPPSTIAILGGVIPSNTSFPPVDTTSLMQFYNISSNTWTTRSHMPLPLNHVNVAVINGLIYVLGGLAETFEEDGKRIWQSVGDSFVYTPANDSWTSLPSMPAGDERGSAAVGVYKDKIYLAAGMLQLELVENGKQQSTDIVSVFNTRTWEWEDVPEAARQVPEARDHAGVAVVGSKFYVLGGRNTGQENNRGTVFILDLCRLDAGWKTSSARMPTARGGVASGTVGHKVYVFGGEGNRATESGVFDQVEVYDTRKDRWETAGTMQVPRHGTYAVGVRGKVYIPGGGVMQGGGPVSGFDVFTPGS